MAAPPRPAPPSTFGLATQLRTPPLDGASFSPTSTGTDSAPRSPQHSQKVTPAMKADGSAAGSPRLFTMPQWGAKESPRGKSEDGHAASHGSPHSSRSGMDEFAEGGGGRYPVHVKKGLHVRNKSSPQSYGSNRLPTTSPHRPPRPDSPARVEKAPPVPLPPPVPRPSEHTATGAPVFNKVDFSFGSQPPLDLGIKLDPVYSTYKASKSTPDVSSPAGKSEGEDTPYAAQVRVSVAQRVERAPSFRKASLAELNLDGMHRRASQATTSSNRSSLTNRDSNSGVNDGGSGGLAAPQLRPPRAASPNGIARPYGQGMRSSYAGSTTSSNGGNAPAAPVVFRRASSVYIPNPSSAPPAAVTAGLPSSSSAAGIVSAPGQTPQSAILPGSKLPLNLLTLARRTAHISDVPGYAWRLNLLEKLELIMGSFLTVADAEAILSIGNGPEKRKTNRSESRKSQIGMPSSFNLDEEIAKQTKHRASKTPEPKTFFGRMKRALSNPGVHVPKETPPPLPTSKKAVFGVPLAQVAEYGFVTSMIAGQRHDLPGVVFSTVEEIYRRGQGVKVPGLLKLDAEPSRLAGLIRIYDTPPDYGEHHDLSIESIHNVTSLLKRYLRDLPEPVLDQRLWRLFLAACVDSKKSLKSRIACAQIILRLLPTANFSLLVYLVAFLSQMPLFPQNQLPLEEVSGIFGSSIMAPRPKEQKKPAKGEMVISGPTDSLYAMNAMGETIKKGRDALLWLLNNWSSVADGLLESDFDLDPTIYMDKTTAAVIPPMPRSVAERQQLVERERPDSVLHIQQQNPLPTPPTAPLNPTEMDVEEELRSWVPSRGALSPQPEQRTLELSSVEQFNDVRQSYDSPTQSPQVPSSNGLQPSLDRNGAVSPSSARSHRSPYLASHQQQTTPRANGFGTPKSPSSVYDAELEETGPPTPQKEISQPFFAHHRAASALQALPALSGHSEQQAQVVNGDEEDDELAEGTPVPNRANDSSPSFDTNGEEPPHMEPSSSTASSERSASVVTPRESQTVQPRPDSLSKSLVSSERESQYRLDDLLDYDEHDNTSVYSFPSPPITMPLPAGRPSPFLQPSPFLTQEEIAAARMANSSRELDSLPPPPNPADYAHATGLGFGVGVVDGVKPAPVLEEKLFAPKALPTPGVGLGNFVAAAHGDDGDEDEEEDEHSSMSRALVPVDKADRAPGAADVEKLLASMPAAEARAKQIQQEDIEDDDEEAQAEADEDASDLPSARPPVPMKSPKGHGRSSSASATMKSPSLPFSSPSSLAAPSTGHKRSISTSPAIPSPADEFGPLGSRPLSFPSSTAPGEASSTLLRPLEAQLVDAQSAAERSRKEVQNLWAKLAELENERMEERREMGGLRREVEGWKKRMEKRLSQGAAEREEKARRVAIDEAEERARHASDEAKKARDELELVRIEGQHVREEAARAREEVGALKGEVKKLDELRAKEQEDARMTIEALEAQLSSIRAVLLGGAGIKI
ncbi:hypothetical protein JCM11251_002642 [Rhodosporidiobolus azoricus]